jgi:hypothetical protein
LERRARVNENIKMDTNETRCVGEQQSALTGSGAHGNALQTLEDLHSMKQDLILSDNYSSSSHPEPRAVRSMGYVNTINHRGAVGEPGGDSLAGTF